MPELRPFQLAGSFFLYERARALLLDDAGLGKSAEVLHAADKLGLERILVVGPAVAGVSWPVQVETWSPARKFVRIAGRALLTDPGVYFVSYDFLSMKANRAVVAQLASALRWDLVVLDEAQYLKNAAANRTEAVYGKGGIVYNAKRVWVLSGTLAPNHLGELYTHLSTLFPSGLLFQFNGHFPSQVEFEDRYCNVEITNFGRTIRGSRNIAELRAAMSPIMLRRRKSEVLRDLPKMEWLTAPLDLDRAAIALIYEDAGLDDAETAAEILASQPNLARQRRALGVCKLRGAIEWIRDRLDAGEPKVIVFAHHTDVIEGLGAGLLDYSPVTFAGGDGRAARESAVNAFQDDPDTRVFIGQIKAAGTAITLTAAKCVFFVEFSGTPGDNYQAASRAHRLGQHDGVQVYFGMAPDTLDERIASTAARRARDIAELFD